MGQGQPRPRHPEGVLSVVEKQRTREQLASDVLEERSRRQAAEADLQSARHREKQHRAETDDLKERLAVAEAENARMRGYIARVQEDDVVREDLVPVGDPAGEQQLVPKRKPATFGAANPYFIDRSVSEGWRGDAGGAMSSCRDRPKPKHWVTY